MRCVWATIARDGVGSGGREYFDGSNGGNDDDEMECTRLSVDISSV